jgi:hypothetical protein
MRSAAVLAPFALFALSACASNAPISTTGEQTVRVVGQSGAVATMSTTATARPRITTLEAPLEEVWRALPAAYAAVGIEVAQTDVQRGVIGNPGFRARRRLGDTPLVRYLDCGSTQGGNSAESYEVHFSVLSEVTRDERGRTVLSTVVDATARPVNFPGDPVRCMSKGELERLIAASASARAGTS